MLDKDCETKKNEIRRTGIERRRDGVNRRRSSTTPKVAGLEKGDRLQGGREMILGEGGHSWGGGVCVCVCVCVCV